MRQNLAKSERRSLSAPFNDTLSDDMEDVEDAMEEVRRLSLEGIALTSTPGSTSSSGALAGPACDDHSRFSESDRRFQESLLLFQQCVQTLYREHKNLKSKFRTRVYNMEVRLNILEEAARLSNGNRFSSDYADYLSKTGCYLPDTIDQFTQKDRLDLIHTTSNAPAQQPTTTEAVPQTVTTIGLPPGLSPTMTMAVRPTVIGVGLPPTSSSAVIHTPSAIDTIQVTF
jgi:hypothetical protein